MRDAKRLAAIRKLPCVMCGRTPVDAAHSNQGAHNKGRGIKACDSKTVSLCASCHEAFDQFKLGNREESEALFDGWLVKTNRMLNIGYNNEVF